MLLCIGGRGDGTEPLSAVECYDPRVDTWVPVCGMNNRRRHVGVAATGTKVYAVGGYSGYHHLNSVEVYNVKTNQWSRCNPMKVPR